MAQETPEELIRNVVSAREILPTLDNVKRHAGIAGQFSVTADVTYPGEDTARIEFVGSTFGGPVVMVTNGNQTFVQSPDRFGEFGTEWVRKFFGPRDWFGPRD